MNSWTQKITFLKMVKIIVTKWNSSMQVFFKKSRSRKRKRWSFNKKINKLIKWKVLSVLHLRKIFNLLKKRKKVKWMIKKVLASIILIALKMFKVIKIIKGKKIMKIKFRWRKWNNLKYEILTIHLCHYRNNKINSLFRLMALKIIFKKMIRINHS